MDAAEAVWEHVRKKKREKEGENKCLPGLVRSMLLSAAYT